MLCFLLFAHNLFARIEGADQRAGNGSMAVALTVRFSERDVPVLVLVGGCPGETRLPQKNVTDLQGRKILAGPISVSHIDSMTRRVQTKCLSRFPSQHAFRFFGSYGVLVLDFDSGAAVRRH
jgi:hypothetical protein